VKAVLCGYCFGLAGAWHDVFLGLGGFCNENEVLGGQFEPRDDPVDVAEGEMVGIGVVVDIDGAEVEVEAEVGV
jgi:hypothetical protein